jgi:hypothetical protein
MTCRWSDCWCRRWPPLRQVLSTGVFYTVVELRSRNPRVRRFAYRYTEAAP